MRKCANNSPYMRRPLVIYDFATAPLWISLFMKKIWFPLLSVYTLQKHNTENSKQIFPEKELRGLSPKFPHSCFYERFVNFQDRSAYSVAGKYVDRFREYINRSQTHECGNWDWGHAIPFLGMHKWDFRCCAVYIYSSSRKDIEQNLGSSQPSSIADSQMSFHVFFKVHFKTLGTG